MLQIETERLFLRLSTDVDFDANYQILVDEIEGEQFTRDAYVPEFQFDVQLALQPLGQQFWRPSLFLKAAQRYIGYCPFMPRLWTREEQAVTMAPGAALPPLSSLETEIGWAISARYQNHGYATEAARALIAYGFDTLHLPRIIAFTTHDNLASLRVMEKVGMRLTPYLHSGDVVGVIDNDGTAHGVLTRSST